jgi:hypothetical protein
MLISRRRRMYQEWLRPSPASISATFLLRAARILVRAAWVLSSIGVSLYEPGVNAQISFGFESLTPVVVIIPVFSGRLELLIGGERTPEHSEFLISPSGPSGGIAESWIVGLVLDQGVL